MLSEPVFLIPILAWMGGMDIGSLLIIIAIFQIMSIFSVQLGKYRPPEYQSGAVIAFILFGMCNIPMALAISAGILSAYVFNMLFTVKIAINQRIINTCNNIYLELLYSIITSIIIYFMIYFIVWHLGQYFYYYHISYNIIPVLLAFTLLKAANTHIKPSGMALFSISLITVVMAALCLI